MIGNALAIATLLGLCCSQTVWAVEDADQAACGQKTTTIDIAQCLMARVPGWDARLNKAYKAAMAASESDARKTALLKAERAWVVYRDENCGWYGAQEGTIRQIAAAQCMLSMTRDRATELETANKP